MRVGLLLLLCSAAAFADEPRVLRVCADPNNLPFSNEKEQGFENALATLLAKETGRQLQYTWYAQRRAFIRNTFKADLCDVWMGMPTGAERVLTTQPIYRSTYVFVSKKGAVDGLSSYDDPRLRKVRIGVQIIGDDMNNTPPVHSLSERGIVQNVKGYRVVGDYSLDSPPLEILRALERGEIDVAVVWGPLSGGLAKKSPKRWTVSPVHPGSGDFQTEFSISVAVRKDAPELKAELEGAIAKRRKDIDALVDAWRIPRVGGDAR